MMSNGFRRERNSQNEGIPEHIPVGLQRLMRTFDPKQGAFKVKFKRHCKSAENTWRDFGFQLVNYFNGWFSGLKIYDFDRLKQLVIVEQMKEQVSSDIQQHFIDDWSRIVTVDDLTEKQELNNRSGYDKRNSFQKSVTCFNCGRVGHLARFCRDKKDGRGKTDGKVAEVNVSEVQVAEFKVVEDECKVVLARFNDEVVRENNKCSAVQLKMSYLKIVKISYGGTEYEAVVDSGAQISMFKSSIVGKEVDYKGRIMLQPAFGNCLKAEIKEVDIGLVTKGYITPVIKTVVPTVDGLNTDILLDTETYEALLEQERIYSPRLTAAMNLRSESSKKSLDESVNTEEEEQEPTITEYDEENGNNTEKFKKQQQICDTLQEA
ncbi:retrovirus-related Pol polyprotein from transposon opus [Trichonephila clavipes]|nr:retrovirus-related Pol polyprotein from transposon opus [Trichonephila clavipes]